MAGSCLFFYCITFEKNNNIVQSVQSSTKRYLAKKKNNNTYLLEDGVFFIPISLQKMFQGICPPGIFEFSIYKLKWLTNVSAFQYFIMYLSFCTSARQHIVFSFFPHCNFNSRITTVCLVGFDFPFLNKHSLLTTLNYRIIGWFIHQITYSDFPSSGIISPTIGARFKASMSFNEER